MTPFRDDDDDDDEDEDLESLEGLEVEAEEGSETVNADKLTRLWITWSMLSSDGGSIAWVKGLYK